MSRLGISAYPSQINARTRTIPIDLALDASFASVAVAINTSKSSPNLSIYTRGGTVYFQGALPNVRIFVQCATLPIEDEVVIATHPLGVPKQIVLTLRATDAAGGDADTIYIGVQQETPQLISTEHRLPFFDDFDVGGVVDPERWTDRFTIAGVEQVGALATIVASNLDMLAPAAASRAEVIQSEIVAGRAFVEWRQVIENVRTANAAFEIGIGFFDQDPKQTGGVINFSDFTGGIASFGFNRNIQGSAFVADPNTNVRCNAKGEKVVGGATIYTYPDTPIVLAGGSTTAVAHDFAIDHDGNTIRFYIDSVLVATRAVQVPGPGCKWFCIFMKDWTNAVAPVGGVDLTINRVAVVADERLVATIAGGSGGAPPAVVTANQGTPAVDANAWPTKAEGFVQSQPAPNPSAVRGTTPTAIDLDPTHAQESHARVLTDEGDFSTDFTGAVGFLGIPTGNWVFTNGSATVTSAAGAALTEMRQGQYFMLQADYLPGSPLRWAQIAAVVDNNTVTLSFPYAGAGGAAGAAYLVDWVPSIDSAGGAINQANSQITLTADVNNGDTIQIWRRIAVAGRKGSACIRAAWYASLTNRRANQQVQIGLELDQGASLPNNNPRAHFILYGNLADTSVACNSSGGALAQDNWQEFVAIPAGGLAANGHLYEIVYHHGVVEFFIDGERVAVHPYHIARDYSDFVAHVMIDNTGAVGGVTSLNIDAAKVQSYDEIDVRASQPDASKLRASTVDITPNGPALADSTAIGVDVVVNCAATVAGQRYRVSVVGGAGFCIRCDAQNPVVTDEPWYDGQKFTFVATVADAAGVRAIKRTAATADGSVIVTAIV